MKPSDLVKRIDQLLALGEAVLATKSPVPNGSWNRVDTGAITGFRAAVLSFIEMHFGTSHSYYVEFSAAVKGNDESHAKSGIAIVKAIRGEVEGGWLISIKSLVAAEIFADFIEMADHLLDAGYKDPSAVILGGVLEEHLRRLTVSYGLPVSRLANGVDVPLKAEILNQELAKVDAYNKLDQKSVTAWLDLRNKAAHGKYTEYEAPQVSLMRSGLLDFMSRKPV